MKKILLITIIFIIASCKGPTKSFESQGTYTTIDVNSLISSHSDINENDIINKIENVVCLETTQEGIVGNIFNIIVASNRIFIFDDFNQTGVIIFDRNGKLVRRLPNGNGPGEIFNVQAIEYDEINSELVVLNSPYLMIYTIDGIYKRTDILPFEADGLAVVGDYRVFCHMPTVANDDIDGFYQHSHIVTDNNLTVLGNMINKCCDFNIFNPYRARSTNTCVNVASPGNDTLYIFKDGELNYLYVLDYCDYKIDLSQFATPVEYTIHMIKKNDDKCVFEGRFLETNVHLIVTLNAGKNNYTVYYDKVNNKACGGYGITYNNEELPFLDSPVATCGDTLISVMLPTLYSKGRIKSDKYLLESDRNKLEAMGSEDNPFIVFYTLKNIE